ncbi:hypothetical protein [Streptomyces microflavus]|uniref:hypothetical protein n=1 Tax=Streptomyces microflavus TaxID=1919 RepID=UPI003B20C635
MELFKVTITPEQQAALQERLVEAWQPLIQMREQLLANAPAMSQALTVTPRSSLTPRTEAPPPSPSVGPHHVHRGTQPATTRRTVTNPTAGARAPYPTRCGRCSCDATPAPPPGPAPVTSTRRGGTLGA